MEETKLQRDNWGSKIGFVLAAAGSAVGLGNIWRFPYYTAENGGAAFVFIYLICVVLIAAPIMIAEFSIGRNSQKNPVGAFRKLAPKSLWPLVGILGVATGIGILSYYAVIAGWTVGYFIKTLGGAFSKDITASVSNDIFANFVSNPYLPILFLFIFIVLTSLVVIGGVSSGIEKWSKILMPMLLMLLLLLTIRSITFERAGEGLKFYLYPDLSKINFNTIVNALGQAFFSLSLGMGTMITYGSYISKKDNLVNSAGYVCFFDVMIAFIAGLMIFPALFQYNVIPDGTSNLEFAGPGLVFKVLPMIFSQMAGGVYIGAAFFFLLSVAALTSTISLLEVPVAYAVDEWHWRRRDAVLLMGGLSFVIGVPSALSSGVSKWLTNIPFIGKGFLDLANMFLGNYSLALGSFFIAIFVGYKWGTQAVRQEIEREGNVFYFRKVWTFLIRFVSPIAIFTIFVYIIVTGNYF